MERIFKVFCDFDGTVALNDVGENFFQTFCPKDKIEIILADLYEQKITPRECYEKEFDVLSHVTKKQFDDFVEEQRIDPYFAEFVHFCREQEVDLFIVSDGFDLYIKKILDKYGLGDISVLTNHLAFDLEEKNDRMHFKPEFPFADCECQMCANCKRNHLVTLSGDEDMIVYIGDGISDRCPVRYADIVFAKDKLIAYCQEENITYIGY